MTRRRFEEDIRRQFVGAVTGVSIPLARVEGYVFIYNPATIEYERRSDRRTRIVALNDGGLVVNIMPREVDPSAIHYTIVDRHLVATDGQSYSLDINEFGVMA